MGTTLSIKYRTGGGLLHNIAARTLNNSKDIQVRFPTSSTGDVSIAINSLDVTNFVEASGGEDQQTIEQIKINSTSHFFSQNRLVTREDYLARVYSMPAEFGRVFRAFVKQNPNMDSSIDLHILSRNSNGGLIFSPDSLKINLSKYLNEFRILTDTVNILDTNIANIGINFEIIVNSNFNNEEVLTGAIDRLLNYFNIENFQIGQSIIQAEIESLIYNTEGVLSVSRIEFVSFAGKVQNRQYNDSTFSVDENLEKGILLCPDDTILEVRYPTYDIRGAAI